MAWIPLESNPDVMNEMLVRVGVPQDWQIVDVYGTDPDLLATVPQPVLAVILLFPITENLEKFLKEEDENALKSNLKNIENLIYFKQYASNACGTIALVHSVANNLDRIKLPDGPLKKLIESVQGLSPEEAGKILVERNDIAQVHEEVAEEGQTKAPDPRESSYHHFVAFIEKDGNLYELDGRKSVPINHSATSKETLLMDAAKVIRKFMECDPENIQFTMMALVAAPS